MALLAFEDASKSPVAELMDVSQRQKTASELNAAILQSQSQVCMPSYSTAGQHGWTGCHAELRQYVQEKEARLPNLLKMVVWAQQQLNEKLAYPRINDLMNTELVEPADS